MSTFKNYDEALKSFQDHIKQTTEAWLNQHFIEFWKTEHFKNGIATAEENSKFDDKDWSYTTLKSHVNRLEDIRRDKKILEKFDAFKLDILPTTEHSLFKNRLSGYTEIYEKLLEINKKQNLKTNWAPNLQNQLQKLTLPQQTPQSQVPQHNQQILNMPYQMPMNMFGMPPGQGPGPLQAPTLLFRNAVNLIPAPKIFKQQKLYNDENKECSHSKKSPIQK